MSGVVEKTWGYERILHNGGYCAKLLVYTRPVRSSLHFHKQKHETFYVASGRFRLELPNHATLPVKSTLLPGDHIVLEPGTMHRLTCLEPGIIVESSSHDDPEDCVRLEPSDP